MANEKTGKETNDHVGCFYRARCLVKMPRDSSSFLAYPTQSKFLMSRMAWVYVYYAVFLSGIFFHFSLFSHSDS